MNASAPVAQLDRAVASGATGREFESLRAHHLFPPLCLTRNLTASSGFDASMDSRHSRFLSLIVVLFLMVGGSFHGWAQDTPTHAPLPSAAPPVYLKVQMDKRLRLSSLRPGDVIEGKLARDAYSEQGEVFASGSATRLSVDHVEKRRRKDSGRWPWVVGALTPRWERFPVFTEARIVGANDMVTTLPVAVVSSGQKTDIQAAPAKDKRDRKLSTASPARASVAPHSGPELLLETHDWRAPSATPSAAPLSALDAPVGTRCRILLLDDIRASTSHANDPVRAVLLEPVLAEQQVVFPAGSVFEGSVTKALRPRMLSRAGTVAIAFHNVTVPGGMRIPVGSSVVGVVMDSKSTMRVDQEGRVHGGPPGLKWLLIDGGVAAGLTKIADDGTQLLTEAIISTATDASTAGTARIAGLCVSGIFMLTRHGRDARLPKYTEMTVTLDRPLPKQPLAAPQAGSALLR